MKKVLSVFMCVVMSLTLLSGLTVSAYETEVDKFSIGSVNSGQVLGDSGEKYYEFSLGSKTSFNVDFDATFERITSGSPTIKIIKKSYFSDYTVGKDVPVVYEVGAKTSNYINHWYDGVATLNTGNYILIIKNPPYNYTFDYTLLFTKTIIKVPQSIQIKNNNKSISFKKLKKKNLTVKAFTLKNAKGKVSYKLIKKGTSAKIWKYLKISKKGVITVKKWKKAKKGTYSIKITITAAGNKNYKKGSKTATIKIKIK